MDILFKKYKYPRLIKFLKQFRIILLYFLLYNNSGYTQNILITEFLASNVINNPEMYDFDDYVDWIELYNPGNTEIILNNFFLTDDFDDLLKWRIPDNTSIESEEYLIIWADDYNESPGQIYTRPYWPWDDYTTEHYHTNFKIDADGEELALSKADQTGNYILIQEGSLWKYLDDGSNQNYNWTLIDFDDTDWNSGNAELGYGDNDEETIVSFGPDDDNKYITTYFRHTFDLNNSNDIQILNFKIKRDDGAIIYLNGIEAVRSNMPTEQVFYDTYANSTVSGSDEDNFFEFTISENDIIDGQNIIAVEIHQISESSSDISFDFELTGTGYSNTVLVDSTTFDRQIKDVSRGRGIDNNTWYYFGEPTPGTLNNTMSTISTDKSNQIIASLESGFYNEIQIITLSTLNETEQIYYTLDGSRPGSNTNLYIGPITIENTTVLKARSIMEEKLPGEILTVTYFIDEQSYISTVSLIAEPETLWDPDIGIYENEYKQRKIPVTIEYFTQDNELGFTVDAGARLGGLNIWTKPQKPFTIYLRGRFGDDYINYQVVENKQITNFSRIVFRNGGDDWEETLIRDPMTESLAMGMMNCGYMAYTPSALYLNGTYWGIHNIREKFNTHYFLENFNANPNNIDHLEYTSTQSGTQMQIVEGNDDHYNSMINYIQTNDLNQSSVYNQINELMDIDSFIDFLVMTLYTANTSWGHNREWWRPRTEIGKWQWLMVDIDRGFNINNTYTNLLDDLIDDYELFQSLLISQSFKNRFIQRAASHFSNTFNSERITSIVDSLKDKITLEIPRHIDRWGNEGSVSSMNAWENNIDEILQFSQSRNAILYSQFISEFSLDGTTQINIAIDPPESGIILINDVPMNHPEGEGVYFKNKPISLLAQPKPGFEFLRWDNVSDSIQIEYNCLNDSSFTAIFQISDEEILPELITENILLTNEQPYVIINDLTVTEGITLTINDGVEIRMPDDGNIIINGQLVINGNEENPVRIIPNSSAGASRWGAMCFNNDTDTSTVSYLSINGASTGNDPMIHHGSISSINSHIILDNILIENVEFPIYVEGGSISISNSSFTSEFICDYINVKGGNAIIEDCVFYGQDAADTDAIDLDNVVGGIIRNNHIYDFIGSNSDGIDIGENSEGIIISSNLIYHSGDKGISIGQESTASIDKNLIIGCDSGIAIKDNAEVIIENNTFFYNDTSISCFEKNEGEGGGIAEVINNIFSYNISTSIYSDELSVIDVKYSLSDSELLDGEGNLFSDPLFISQTIYNLELDSSSPCVDSGNPNSNTDPDGSLPDMGAYYVYNSDDYPFEIPEILIGTFRINELLANNESNITDEEGEYEDWIELYFNISSTINLDGYSMTDDMNNPQKWIFPEIEISGEGHLLFWADNEEEGNMHTNFRLSTNGEDLAIFNPDGYLIDGISFQEQYEDISYGRITDGSNEWQFFENPTPGASNFIIDNFGDLNGDGLINVLDVVLIVNLVLDQVYNSNADLNEDDSVDILDVVQLVNIILGDSRLLDATSAQLSQKGESFYIAGNGYIGAVQMTLSHNLNFSINLTDSAMVSEYRTNGTTTTLIVVAPTGSKIFTTFDSYEIDEVIVMNSNDIINIIEPTSYSLSQAYPNPFNPITRIDFSIPTDSNVSIKVYDILGKQVASLADEYYGSGYHTLIWNANEYSSGIYFVKMIAENFIATQKLMLVK